ncbi:hypothetical protein EDC04DRAFT_3150890 [Pisolithus marmoratus]|nr:hypothetical protein EDC04DRAFT_3150890 [Pisolithus marmoratus]
MSITLFVPNSPDASIQYQLTINVTPVSIGLFNSVLSLALSCYMIRSQPADPTVQLSSFGVLEVMWLSSRHPELLKVIGSVKSSNSSSLRKAGNRCTTIYGHSSQSGDKIDGKEVVGTKGAIQGAIQGAMQGAIQDAIQDAEQDAVQDAMEAGTQGSNISAGEC